MMDTVSGSTGSLETAMGDDWRGRARDAATQRRTIWLWSPIFLGVGLLAIVGGATAPVVWIRWSGLVCGSAMALWGFLYGTAIYMRTVDEQERDANLWGCYVGMCVYFLAFGGSVALAAAGHPVAHADAGVFALTAATVFVTFAWKRFR